MIIKKTRAQYQRTVRKIHDKIDNSQTGLLSYAMKKGFKYDYYKPIMHIFNSLRKETKYYHVWAFENICHAQGKEEYSTQITLYAAKPQYYYQQHDLREVKNQSYSVLRLNNVKIIGASVVVLLSPSEAIYEPYSHDAFKLWDYKDPVIKCNLDKQFLIQCKKSKAIINEGIMLSGDASYNFYHFIFEFLSKFLFINELDLPVNIPIIVDEVVRQYPQLQELLNCFNKNNREIIYLKPGYSYDVKTLYYLPFINIIPANYKDLHSIKFTDNLFSLESIKYLRDSLLPKMTAVNCKKKIFIARRNSTVLRRYNEVEVEKIFEKYDFQVVCPEKHSLSEQIYIFNNADFIAGATGAAFSNILFCSPGCKVLCINSYNVELSIFSTIAKYLGSDFQYLSAYDEKYKTQNLHEEFKIDPEKVENRLIDFLNR